MLKTHTWLTDNTEILTVNGWVDISLMSRIENVIVMDLETNLFSGESILEYNKMNYSGKIIEGKDKDIYYTAQQIYFPKNRIYKVGYDVNKPNEDLLKYEGKLYNIVTPTNTFIFRNYTHNYNNFDDYNIALCKIVK